MTKTETQEWITSETRDGLLAIIESVLKCHSVYTCNRGVYVRDPLGNSKCSPINEFIQRVTNGYVYAIKNPNYIKLPKRGEIWRAKHNLDCAYCYSDFEKDNGNLVMPAGDRIFILVKEWEFTGEKTDLFDKLDSLTDQYPDVGKKVSQLTGKTQAEIDALIGEDEG